MTPIARRLHEGGGFLASLHRVGVRANSPQLAAIKRTMQALASAKKLPGPLDYEVPIPPVHAAWCRRIAGHNLWLFYRTRDDVVYALFVTRSPPIPAE